MVDPGSVAGRRRAYPWDDWVAPRCHHPLRLGERLYVSYWHHGLFILDISDMARPKMVAHAATSPAFPHPTHTCLPIPQPLKGRRIMVVADEDVAKLRPSAPSFAWIYDITVEQMPVPIATFQVPGLDLDGSPQPAMSGCHQPSERLRGTRDSVRLVRAGPAPGRHRRPVRAAGGRPFPARSAPTARSGASSNDVTIDDRGLIYLVDRVRGVDIIETIAFG